MELSQLKYFMVVAECQHITKAAEKLYITQPTLSKTISTLEKDIGFPLFDRHKNRISLNPAGQAFYAHVTRAMDELQLALSEGKEIYRSSQLEVPVISNMTWFVDMMIEAYIKQNYAAHTKRSIMTYNDVAQGLLSKKFAFAFLDRPVNDPRIKWTHLITEDVFVICGQPQPEAKNGLLSIAALRGQSFIAPKPEDDWRVATDSFCREAGFHQKVVFDNLPIPSLYELLRRMSANMLVPAHNALRYYQSLLRDADPNRVDRCHVYRICESNCRLNFGLAENTELELNEPQRDFMDLACEVVRRTERENTELLAEFFK